MKNLFLLGILLNSCFFAFGQQGPTASATYPLEANEQHSLMAAWEKKPILGSKLVDDMETNGRWKVTSIGQMSYTKDRAKDGKQSLRFLTSVRDTAYLGLPGNKTKWGSQYFNLGGQAGASAVHLRFETPQDWSKYNRISFWVYVHPTSLPRHNINLGINNQGTVSTILSSARSHYTNDLKPGQWNHVIFEMPHLERNKVTMFSLTRELTGNNPGEDEIAVYDIDNLEIQRVETDQYEGWNVSPEKFSFSHIGYRPNDAKVAMVGTGGSTGKFELINQQNKTVFSGNVKSAISKNGTFNQLDFSDFKTAGIYRIRCGALVSNPFPINDNVWMEPIAKALNFYFCERCGYEVPGLHKACHMDWQGFRGDVKKIINGGYHDAGDLSQGIWRTSMSTYAMLNNLDMLQQRNAKEMTEKMRSEIAWGLQYLLKTRFGDGFHIHWCRMRMFTDNVIGTVDDVLVPAENIAWENFLAAAVESKAAAVFEKLNPELARQVRAAAIDDWQAAVASRINWDQATFEEASWGVTSSLLLAKLTGDEKYKKQAVLFGKLLIKCQEQNFIDGIPITGYFYSNTSRQRVIHNRHTAFEEAPMIALAMLCKELPENENWIDWYSSAVLYSEFFMKRGSQISAPYSLLPNSVWAKSEITGDKDEKRRDIMLQQFSDGTRLNDEYVLRTFPIWNDNLFHGNTNIQLSNTWALAEASRLRNDAKGMKLVGKQLEWVMGANPFGQSLMYGSGYDFAPQFVYCLKDIVGALPVGMDSRAGDMPYWPATVSATFKEIWIESVNRFMGAVSVYSSWDQSAKIKQQHDKNIQIQTNIVQLDNGMVSIILTITGTGVHDLEIKAFNAKASLGARQVRLSAGKKEKTQFQLRVTDHTKPYIAVVSADKNPNLRKEIVGSYSDASILTK